MKESRGLQLARGLGCVSHKQLHSDCFQHIIRVSYQDLICANVGLINCIVRPIFLNGLLECRRLNNLTYSLLCWLTDKD